MITDEIVEKAAEALWQAASIRAAGKPRRSLWLDESQATREVFRHDARAALSAVAPMIRAAALEEAAKVAESAGDTWSGSRCVETAIQEAAVDDKCVEIAADIRTMKEPT